MTGGFTEHIKSNTRGRYKGKTDALIAFCRGLLDDEEFQASGVDATEVFDGDDLILPLHPAVLNAYLASTCDKGDGTLYAPDNPQAHISALRNLYATHGVSMPDDCETIIRRISKGTPFVFLCLLQLSLRVCEI